MFESPAWGKLTRGMARCHSSNSSAIPQRLKPHFTQARSFTFLWEYMIYLALMWERRGAVDVCHTHRRYFQELQLCHRRRRFRCPSCNGKQSVHVSRCFSHSSFVQPSRLRSRSAWSPLPMYAPSILHFPWFRISQEVLLLRSVPLDHDV